MEMQQTIDAFIGRTNEIDTFSDWLTNPEAPWILYIHDATDDTSQKGGIGKTWLLRRYAKLAKKLWPEIAVVTVDFFNTGDRDGVFLAEKLIDGFQELYPTWTPAAFREAIQQMRSQGSASTATESAEVQAREVVWGALAEDLRHLEEKQLLQEQKMLLIVFDTFEVIEQNPGIAVLRQAQTFPDRYLPGQVKVVIAGRNKLDWTHPNWLDREQEVQDIALVPFNQREMLEYLKLEYLKSDDIKLAPQSKQADALYERTQGRPIIIGLAIDVLNNRILEFDELVRVPKTEFESHLIPQVNKLERPINWAILFMAHVYHHFNKSILEWVLRSVPVAEPLQSVSHEHLSAKLLGLSFVRRSGSGDDFVLHDEMRRLVTKYCWDIQDPGRPFRKAISSSMIIYYSQEMTRVLNEQQRQGYVLETLYHRFFVNVESGLLYFQEQFNIALLFLKTAFARLLLQEAQQFRDLLPPYQRNDLLLAEVWLLRSEENAVAALEILQRLRREVGTQWYEDRLTEILLEEGRCYMRQGRMPEAADRYMQCLSIEQALGHEAESAHLLDSLGLISRKRGQFPKALSYYEDSIAIYKKLGKQQNYADVLMNTTHVYRFQGKIEEALRKCKFAWRIRLELFKKGAISEVLVGLSLNTLGMIYLDAGNLVQAEYRFQEAFDIFLRLNYKKGIATIYNRFGHVQLLKGALESARDWFRKAEEASQEIDKEQYTNSLNKQGRICALQEKWVVAETFFEQAIASARQSSDYYQQTESLVESASVLEHLGKEGQWQQYLQEAEDISVRENYENLLGQIEQVKGEIDYRAGRYPSAFQHFTLYCHHMAQYNFSEFNAAVQKVIDALLGVPKNYIPAIVQDVLAYWAAQQLDKVYPELTQAFEEVNDIMLT